MTSSKAKVVFFQEHKVRKRERKKHRRELRGLGWSVHFGPCDESSKVASAGVGVMWRDDEVQVYPEKIGDEDLAKARDLGRAGKYIVNLRWDYNYLVYPVYGKIGGSKEAIAVTEAILQAVKREGRTENHKPTTGDFNKEPSTLQTVKVWKKEESWVDVGEAPSWWGRTPNEPTCHSRQKANPTRIDGYVVNPAFHPKVGAVGEQPGRGENVP